jgi:DNA-binding SARP family transcriptional activator
MHGPAKMLEIKLLGRFRHSGSHDDLPKKAQALLAYLAMNRGHAIPRDRLADLLWSTSGPEQGRQSLRQSLAAVRRALGADARGLVETVGADVQLAASGAVDVDVHRFEMLAQSTARADLAAANELYRGEFLAGFDVPSEPFMDWVRVERTRLEATACGTLGRLVAALSEAGEHDAAIAAAQRLIAFDPLREDGHRLLMQLYASVGRRAEAVRQFAVCTDSLRRKLGVAPDAQTIALARAIQAEEPAQALAAGGGAAEHVPAAVPADAEIPVSAGPASDHVHDVADVSVETHLPMEAGATRRGAAMPTPAPVAAAVTDASPAWPAGTKDGVARERRADTRWPIRALATFSVVAACVAAAGAGIWRFNLSSFDGTWSVYLVCPSVGTVQGYTYRFSAGVKDGILHGETGIAGTPAWLAIDGPIRADGRAILSAKGLVGNPATAFALTKTGTSYSYTIEASFDGTQGSGNRLELRPCTVSFTKI